MKSLLKLMCKMSVALLCCSLLTACVTTDNEALYYNPGLYKTAPAVGGSTGIPNYDLFMVD